MPRKSVKNWSRLGFNVSVHGRNLRQRYSGVADWDYITEVVDAVETPVIANGDVVDAKTAEACLSQTRAGLMLVVEQSVVLLYLER